jgi:thiamine biosynthesis lipoprotein
MGSRLVLQVAGGSAADAEIAWVRASTEMAGAEAALSRFREDSALSRLNAAVGSAAPLVVDRRLRRMLALAHRAQRLTGGRFDPRTLEAMEALGERAGVRYTAPATPPLSCDTTWLRRAGREQLWIGAPIDSGGLGKGLGLRWALNAARRAAPRASGLLLDAGGDVVTHGTPRDADAWQIGIEDPSGSGEPLAVVAIRGGALATSSTAVRSWRAPDGSLAHHLIDPRTWRPADGGLRAVTVAHADPAWAEIWSKALFLGGAQGIADEARSRDLAAWWIDRDGGLAMTPAARQASVWVDEARLG